MRFLNRIALTVAACSVLGGAAIAQVNGPLPLDYRWQQSSPAAPTGHPAVNGDVIYVASGQRCYALNRADGNELWRWPSGEPLPALVTGTPAFGNGAVYVSTSDRQVFALNQADGTQLWRYKTQEAIVGSPKTSNGLVFVARADDSIVALDAKTGAEYWPVPLKIQDGINGSFDVMGSDIIVANGDNRLLAINTATRQIDWSQKFTDLGVNLIPVVAGDTIYVAARNYLVCLNGASGKPTWFKQLPDNIEVAPGVSDKGVVAVANATAYCFSLSGDALTPKGIPLPSDITVPPAGLPGGNFAIPTADGSLNLVSPTDGILWTYVMRPIGGVQDAPTTTSNTGLGGPGGPGGPSSGGPGGPPGGPSGAGGSKGSGISRGNTSGDVAKIVSVTAAAQPVLAGSTLLVMAHDSSLLAFDATNGVDVTGPTVSMSFPNPGEVVNPDPPLALVFKVMDEGSGVKEDSIKITIDGVPYTDEYQSDGVAIVRFDTDGKNKPLTNGRRIVVVTASDWLGNTTKETYIVNIDDTVPPVNYTPDKSKTKPGLGGKGGGGNGAGAGA